MRPSAVPHSRVRQTKPSRFRLSPFMSGLAAGLLTAALVALYITQSPLPFVDRVGTRSTDKAKLPGQQTESDQAIDPNKGLHAKDSGEVETAAEAGIETKTVSPTGMTYLIQVGAFKAIEDAEQMRARMAILGFEARVSNTEKDGQTLHRVRVGPYSSIEELNKSKQRVSENGIDSTVIRVNMN